MINYQEYIAVSRLCDDLYEYRYLGGYDYYYKNNIVTVNVRNAANNSFYCMLFIGRENKCGIVQLLNGTHYLIAGSESAITVTKEYSVTQKYVTIKINSNCALLFSSIVNTISLTKTTS